MRGKIKETVRDKQHEKAKSGKLSKIEEKEKEANRLSKSKKEDTQKTDLGRK